MRFFPIRNGFLLIFICCILSIDTACDHEPEFHKEKFMKAFLIGEKISDSVNKPILIHKEYLTLCFNLKENIKQINVYLSNNPKEQSLYSEFKKLSEIYDDANIFWDEITNSGEKNCGLNASEHALKGEVSDDCQVYINRYPGIDVLVRKEPGFNGIVFRKLYVSELNARHSIWIAGRKQLEIIKNMMEENEKGQQ